MRKILLPVANVCRVLVGALFVVSGLIKICLLYTSDAADES